MILVCFSLFIRGSLSFTVADVPACAEEQVLNQSDADDVLGGENDDEEAVAMIEESLSGTIILPVQFIMML